MWRQLYKYYYGCNTAQINHQQFPSKLCFNIHHNFLSELDNWVPDVDPGGAGSIDDALHHDDTRQVDFTEGLCAEILIAGKGTGAQENLKDIQDYQIY